MLRLIALPLALLSLTACVGTTTAGSGPPATDPASSPAAATSSGAPRATPSASPSTETASEDPQSSGGTALTTIWVDSTWSVEERSEDLCAVSAVVSPFTLTGDRQHVMCGPTAADTMACAIDGPDDTVTCIVDPLAKKAIRFRSPALAAGTDVSPREGEAIPLYVALPDGVNCAPITHDHDQHFGGQFSWYRCEDGSELLTPDEIDATFERGEPWVVQRSRDQQAPEATAVTAAIFAQYEG
ncbi:hypothetical protein Bequi_12410 [Brachybacterium sp. JHP9]|uniref:Uncharacterized protein n=1 Tax=Brachybacterium equifaecis TaxID=2910770 RepID=A0ABT0R2K9_9MICO|nr:hypothetical protein [Brachybacterium equifaecis]MCL6424170.1 hypothetical protein [Brachybacterium equifaecis]